MTPRNPRDRWTTLALSHLSPGAPDYAAELVDMYATYGRSGWGQWVDYAASAVNVGHARVMVGEADVERALAPLLRAGLLARSTHASGAVYLSARG